MADQFNLGSISCKISLGLYVSTSWRNPEHSAQQIPRGGQQPSVSPTMCPSLPRMACKVQFPGAGASMERRVATTQRSGPACWMISGCGRKSPSAQEIGAAVPAFDNAIRLEFRRAIANTHCSLPKKHQFRQSTPWLFLARCLGPTSSNPVSTSSFLGTATNLATFSEAWAPSTAHRVLAPIYPLRDNAKKGKRMHGALPRPHSSRR